MTTASHLSRLGRVLRLLPIVGFVLCLTLTGKASLAQASLLDPSSAGGDRTESVLANPGIVSAASTALRNPSSLNPLEVLDSAGRSMQRATGGKKPGGGDDEPGLSAALNVMLVLTVVSLAPSVLLMCTCFMRIIIVLGMLRQAIGTSTVPPPQVVTALALFMTLMVMSPTIERIDREALAPYRAGEIRNYDVLWAKASQPMRDFMFDQIEATDNWSSLYAMLQYRGVDTSDPSKITRGQVDMVALVPAYMLSELKTAFLMGFKIYLPFLVIDMVVSTVLISMSMMMLPPVLISLPFKLLLFVLVDGWTLVVGSLMTSFAQPAELHAMLPIVEQGLRALTRIT